MPDAHKNFAYSTVATAPSPASSGTSLVVASGDGAKFPAVPFNATVWAAGAQPTTANSEIVRVTAISTDTLTITRAQESTTARTVVVGDQIAATVTAKSLTDIEVMTVGGDLTGTLPNPTIATGAVTSAKILDGTIANADLAAGATGLAVYGDGSDGTVTFDGSSTVLTLVPSANTYTMLRDIFLAAGTINNGVTIITNGYRIFCAGTFTNNGTIQWNGANGANASGGAATARSTSSINTNTATGPGAAGTNGTTTTGNNGTNAGNPSLGGTGGGGGTGTSGAGGTGGTVTAPAANQGSIRSLPSAVFGQLFPGNTTLSVVYAGAGGAGGGGDTTNSGGGGGAGGGIVIVVAKAFAGTGAIQARGGTGATRATGNVGGGGGGGGGVVIVISSSVSGGAISGQTIDANGGSKGSPHGTGTDNAANGNSGTTILLPN